jgi:tetratricopeptide (TPR) repeat protein
VQTELGDYPAANVNLNEARGLAETAADPPRLLLSLRYLGVLGMYLGALSRAEEALTYGLTLARRNGDAPAEAGILLELGNLALMAADYTGAEARYRSSLAGCIALNHRMNQAVILANLGELAARRGDYAEARALAQQSLAIDRTIGNRHGVMATLHNLGELACAEGDYNEAVRYFREVLPLARKAGSALDVLYSLQGVARLQVLLGEHTAAADLLALVLVHPAASDDLRAQARELSAAPASPAGLADLDARLTTIAAAAEQWLATLELPEPPT